MSSVPLNRLLNTVSRRAFDAAAVVSFLCCIYTTLLWVRSYSGFDALARISETIVDIVSRDGTLSLRVVPASGYRGEITWHCGRVRWGPNNPPGPDHYPTSPDTRHNFQALGFAYLAGGPKGKSQRPKILSNRKSTRM